MNVDLESSLNSITKEAFLSTTRIVALVSDICSMYLKSNGQEGQYSFNRCTFCSTKLFVGISILTLTFLSLAACIADGIAPILSYESISSRKYPKYFFLSRSYNIQI